jgi:hypothetical protein
MIEETLKKVNQARKIFIAEAQKRQEEVMEKIKAAKAEAAKCAASSDPGGEQKANGEVVGWENTQRALVHEFDVQQMQYMMAIASLEKYIADIEIGCLIIDHLGVRRKVKDKKSGEVGYMRLSAAAFLEEIGDGIYFINKAVRSMIEDSADEEEGDEEEIPEAEDGREVFTEKDAKEIEAKKTKGGDQ